MNILTLAPLQYLELGCGALVYLAVCLFIAWVIAEVLDA